MIRQTRLMTRYMSVKFWAVRPLLEPIKDSKWQFSIIQTLLHIIPQKRARKSVFKNDDYGSSLDRVKMESTRISLVVHNLEKKKDGKNWQKRRSLWLAKIFSRPVQIASNSSKPFNTIFYLISFVKSNIIEYCHFPKKRD